MKHNITLRLSAADYSLSVGHTRIDLSKADKNEKYQVRRTLIEGLKLNGYFGKREQRNAAFRERRGTHG